MINYKEYNSATVQGLKRLSINPEGLVGNFLRCLMFPTQLEVNWFETQR